MSLSRSSLIVGHSESLTTCSYRDDVVVVKADEAIEMFYFLKYDVAYIAGYM